MPNKRSHYSSEFKLKIGLLALSNTMTIGEISSQYEVHPTQVSHWKKTLEQKGSSIFENKTHAPQKDIQQQKHIDTLYKQIGQLTVENDWLKKKSGLHSL